MEIKITKHSKTALVFCASSVVVAPLLLRLFELEVYEKVIFIDEQALDIEHPKLEQIITSFDDLEEWKDKIVANDLFCFADVQRPQPKTADESIKIREMYAYRIAKIAVENGCNQVLLLSSALSNIDSLSLKNRLRAHAEKAVQSLPFWAIHIFRPAVILNYQRKRPNGKTFADKISNPLDFFTGGLASKYRPTEAKVVAQAMIDAAQGVENGTYFYPPGYFQELSLEKSLKKLD